MVCKRLGKTTLRSLSILSAMALTLMASVALAQPNERALANVLKVQSRNSAHLFQIEGVVGTATGLASDGLPAVIVYTKDHETGPLPRAFGRIPVVVEVTGEITALKGKPAPPTVDTTIRFSPSVPIGVSTGNEFFLGSGTIGCRLSREVWEDNEATTVYYALSNHHVFDPWDTISLRGTWPDGSAIVEHIVQPGRHDDPEDTGGEATPANLFGTVAASVPIDYSGGTNQVDASIAELPITVMVGDIPETRDLLTITPSDGYGSPAHGVTVPVGSLWVGMPIQKYGRTTHLTKGTVKAINVDIEVTYAMPDGTFTALFTNQISVGVSRGTFVKAGDSGSLVVTDSGRQAVGLLFAGDARGRTAFINPIEVVLEKVTADLADREDISPSEVVLTIDGLE